MIKATALKKVLHNMTEYGVDGAALAAASRILYLGGYHAQKHLGRWAINE
jgi:hypothetical protein